jgi:hypothetical protein
VNDERYSTDPTHDVYDNIFEKQLYDNYECAPCAPRGANYVNGASHLLVMRQALIALQTNHSTQQLQQSFFYLTISLFSPIDVILETL